MPDPKPLPEIAPGQDRATIRRQESDTAPPIDLLWPMFDQRDTGRRAREIERRIGRVERRG